MQQNLCYGFDTEMLKLMLYTQMLDHTFALILYYSQGYPNLTGPFPLWIRMTQLRNTAQSINNRHADKNITSKEFKNKEQETIKNGLFFQKIKVIFLLR